MTQIFDFVCASFSVHTSDRLTTKNHSDGKPRSHDTTFNKSIIFCPVDAIVVVSFSGPAYINNTPTDTYIASQLHGSVLANNYPDGEGEKDKILFEVGRYSEPPKTFEVAFQRLRRALIHDLPKLDEIYKKMPLNINIVGWLAHKKIPKFVPTTWKITRNFNNASNPINIQSENYWDWDYRKKPYKLLSNPNRAGISTSDLLDAMCQPDYVSMKAVAQTCRDAVLEISKRDPTVGDSILQIYLQPDTVPLAWIIYTPGSKPINGDQATLDAYTPWILGAQIPVYPAILRSAGGTSGTTFVGSRISYKVQVSGPTPPSPDRDESGLLFSMDVHERKEQ